MPRWRCRLRRDDADDHRLALRREGLQALAIGVPLLCTSLLATAGVMHGGLPSCWRTFLAGSLVVVDWVALWCPLDTLLWPGRPWNRERAVLTHLATSLVVRGAETSRLTARRASSTPTPPGPSRRIAAFVGGR